MPKRIVITGGTGFIGRSLANQLHEAGYESVLIGRSEPKWLAQSPHKYARWDGRTVGDWAQSLEGCTAIVNLAGRSVDCIKSPENIDQILRSRVESTAAVGAALRQTTKKPDVWVQMSTAHLYGDSPDITCTEASPFGYGLAPFVGEKWEAAFREALPDGMRGVIIRTSFVLGKNGGALESLLRITRLGLGGTVGNGKQGMSWIHEHDMNAILQRGIEDESMSGPYIASAPEPVDNRTFMKTLRKAAGVHIGLPAPAALVRFGAHNIFRTDPELALYGRYVVPERLVREGFNFRFPQLAGALKDLV
ncbi:TIGR01777 family protein [Neolewinella aurantiaca]|uniref:TIGR01777 family protein n=1 Tax=Neolewinella aurantiaca TaxID=2602767 RepID=A0A5C7FGU7_9BACT|nr:TIGR01777 family oxidoreductase [Neolewinella aurantiaca]TXF90235.1 TIGR01777 family protein [Neolewinella aurantiaca]